MILTPKAAYLEERDLPTLGRYQRMIPEGEATAEHRVRRIFEQLAKSAENPRWGGCSFLRAAAEFANLPGHPARAVASRHKRRFEAWLEEILAADGYGEAAALARQLMILLDGAVAQILIHREPSYALSAADAASTLLERTNKSKRPTAHRRVRAGGLAGVHLSGWTVTRTGEPCKADGGTVHWLSGAASQILIHRDAEYATSEL